MDRDNIKQEMIQAIKTVYDPEIPVDVYELGLIYQLEIDDKGMVDLKMTLTSPACPVAESLPMEVVEKLYAVEGVQDVNMQVVFTPPWSKDRMSEEARFALDMF